MTPPKVAKPEKTVEQIVSALASRGLLTVAEEIAKRRQTPLELVLGRIRSGSVMRARKELYAALRLQRLSYPEIGALLDRDHTTVLSVLRGEGAGEGLLTSEAKDS